MARFQLGMAALERLHKFKLRCAVYTGLAIAGNSAATAILYAASD